MRKVVLDANIFVSALIRPQGPPGQILSAFLNDQAFELVASASIFSELRRALGYPRVRRYLRATEEELDTWVTAIALLADQTEDKLKLHGVAEDPDDDKYLATALEGHAQYVVSGDQHLLSLSEYEGIKIVTARTFLQMLHDEQHEKA